LTQLVPCRSRTISALFISTPGRRQLLPGAVGTLWYFLVISEVRRLTST